MKDRFDSWINVKVLPVLAIRQVVFDVSPE